MSGPLLFELKPYCPKTVSISTLILIDFNLFLMYNENQSNCCSCAPDVNDKWLEACNTRVWADRVSVLPMEIYDKYRYQVGLSGYCCQSHSGFILPSGYLTTRPHWCSSYR